MKREFPVCKRCCFCLPLRYGLLAWGYLKSTADALIIVVMTYALIQAVVLMAIMGIHDYLRRFYTDFIIVIITFIVFFTDFVVTILFIIGGHQKKVRPIRLFYFFSIAVWVASILLIVVAVALSLGDSKTSIIGSWDYYIIIFATYFVILVVQSYVLLLLRSEIIKLRDNSKFRFVNNAAEAECTMKIEEKLVEDETETEEI